MNNLEELKKVALAATPGPWEKCDSYGPNENGTCISAVERPDLMIASTTGYYGRVDGIANTHFIAIANPAVILDLIAQLEAAQKSNAFLKEQLAQLANFNPDWDKLEASQDSWRELAELQKETLHRAEKAEAELSAANEKLSKAVLPPRVEGILKQWQFERDCEWIESIKATGFTVEGNADAE